MDLDGALDALGDPARQLARGDLPLLRQHQQAPAHPGDDDRLHDDHPESNHAEEDVLVEDEEKRSQRLPAEEQGRDDRLADEAPERLDLVLDHGRHLGRFDPAEVGQRETQDVVEQREPEASQHALAHPPLHRIDLQLQQAADHDQREESD